MYYSILNLVHLQTDQEAESFRCNSFNILFQENLRI